MSWLKSIIVWLIWLCGAGIVLMAFRGLRKIAGRIGLVIGFLVVMIILGVYLTVLGAQNDMFLFIVGGALIVLIMVGIGYKIVFGTNRIQSSASDQKGPSGLETVSIEADNFIKLEKSNQLDKENNKKKSVDNVGRTNKEINSIGNSLPKIKPINLPKSEEEYEVIYDTLNIIIADENFPQKESFMRSFLREIIILDVNVKILRNFYDYYAMVYGRINHRSFLAYFPYSVGNLYTTKEFQQFGSEVRSAYNNDFEKMKVDLEKIKKNRMK